MSQVRALLAINLGVGTMKPMLQGGTLRSALQRTSQHALACAALQPIESALHVIEDAGVRFLGFAGSLFVRDEKRFETIAGAGPMAALTAVSGLR